MRLLLDSHILLWRLDDSFSRLPPALNDAISDTKTEVFVSVVTIWELLIKSNKGRLKLPTDLKTLIADAGIDVLPVTSEHAFATDGLPRFHDDPFDRMLIVQAVRERLTLVTHDRILSNYAAPIWLV